MNYVPFHKRLFRRIAHKLLGCSPYHIRDDHYKCYWCKAELHRGVYNLLYSDKDNKVNP